MQENTTIEINKKKYQVNVNEFIKVEANPKYNNLILRKNVGYYERICSLLVELKKVNLDDILVCISPTHGGFLPIECSKYFKKIYIYECSIDNKKNIEENIKNMKIKNIFFLEHQTKFNLYKNFILFDDSVYFHCQDIFIHDSNVIFISPKNNYKINKNTEKTKMVEIYNLSNTSLCVFIPKKYETSFYTEFHYFLDGQLLKYDNLIHLCVIVKNGGEDFRKMLKHNLYFIDRWTILDTGSTDNTMDIIKEELKNKKGELFQEPFIDFGTTRNRCLELAGNVCKFILMLDDTYLIEGNPLYFFHMIRDDQFSDSFSFYSKSKDIEYTTNRLIKTDRGLKYLFKIHEVINPQNNKNVIIPNDDVYILDNASEYMKNRTMNRKDSDLKMLFEEIKNDPDNPRHYYYVAQTYNVLGKPELAFEYFEKRLNHSNPGFVQEKIDALFEAARIANFKLKKPWSLCKKYYMNAYELDKNRPDSLYFIGIHYYLEKKYTIAYKYFTQAFHIGYPLNSQYALKPTLSYYYLPKFLVELCYKFKDFVLGENVSNYFLNNNNPNCDYYVAMLNWKKIFNYLNKMSELKSPNLPNKPLFCFVADGGWDKWTGSDILNKGIGGSETYIIEMARHIQKQGYFNVFVFCNCLEDSIFEGVQYYPLEHYFVFVRENYIHTCFISRYVEYFPVALESHIENVYLVFHDLIEPGTVIPDINNNKFKNIFCLSEWHVKQFLSIFPNLKSKTVSFYYGIDFHQFEFTENKQIEKIPYKFIYSSFPNRGLLSLLIMWPKIIQKYPSASLDIYCDIDQSWVNNIASQEMQECKNILFLLNSSETNYNVNYHGWVDKKTLANSWLSSDVWFYPCKFEETFCLTALESALSKTCVVASKWGALENTVGDRGILIEGNPMSEEWQYKALNKLFEILENTELKNNLIQKNYEWAKTLSWESQSKKLQEEYILPKNMEYRNMYNWTCDLPLDSQSKETFLYYLNHFSKNCNKTNPKILEIGTYTGTSLIEIVNNIPNSYGVGIDRWKNYKEIYTMDNIVGEEVLSRIEEFKIKESFFRNIRNSNLSHKIEGRRGDSTDLLLQMIINGEKYDLIYVDSSHKCLDCYTDIVLAFKILNNHGMIIIDDFLFNKENNIEEDEPNNPNFILESPYQAVLHFIEKYKSEINILHMSYRVFIEKK